MNELAMKIKHAKKRGEWAELRFMAAAAERGFRVTKPWGETAQYDFVVEHSEPTLRKARRVGHPAPPRHTNTGRSGDPGVGHPREEESQNPRTLGKFDTNPPFCQKRAKRVGQPKISTLRKPPFDSAPGSLRVGQPKSQSPHPPAKNAGRMGHPNPMRRFVRVQVKSTGFKDRGGYSCSVRGSRGAYEGDPFDFVAVYVVPEDVWYIIPEEVVRGQGSVALYPGLKRSKYGKYKEGWEGMR